MPNKIRAIREKRGLTGVELAHRLGASSAQLWSWEQERAAPSEETAAAMAKELGVTGKALGVRAQRPRGRQPAAQRINREAVEAALEERGWTASRLAEEIGVVRQAVSQYLAGKVKPRDATLQKMAKKLKREPGELLTDREA